MDITINSSTESLDYNLLNVNKDPYNDESIDMVINFYKGNIDRVVEIFNNNNRVLVGSIHSTNSYIFTWKYLCNYITHYKNTIPNLYDMCLYLGNNSLIGGKKWLAVHFGLRGGWEKLIEIGLRSGCVIKASSINTSTLSDRIINMIMYGVDHEKLCVICYSSYRDYDTTCHSCMCVK